MARTFRIFSILLLISVGLVVAWNTGIAQPGPAGKRIALLMSNEHYAPAIGPLTAKPNDMKTLTAALRKVGFAKGDIHIIKDVGRNALRKAIRDHARRLKVAGKGAVGLLYYKGHAVSTIESNTNYLLPVDVIVLDDPDELEDNAVALSYLTGKLKKRAPAASHYLVVDTGQSLPKGFDAKTIAAALHKLDTPESMLLAYVAPSLKNSFAASLAREIIRFDVLAEDVFKSLTTNARAAGGKTSWVTQNNMSALFFAGKTATVPKQTKGKRLALLIGNNAYNEAVGPLFNPQNDTNLLATALKKIGFDVTLVKDAGYAKLNKAVNRFARRLGEAGPDAVGLFYYSGHGAANPIDKHNYLIPVDVKNAEDTELWDNSIRLNQIIERLRTRASNAARFIIFDACRNELKLKSKSKALGASKGFAPVQNSAGMLIAYATAPGLTASDGEGNNGPYAKALAEEIIKPGLSATDVFINVQLKVKSRIGQDPWLSFPALARIYFNGSTSPAELEVIRQKNLRLIGESKRIAQLAQQQVKEGDYGTALALALEAMPGLTKEGKLANTAYWQSAQMPLDQAIRKLREKKVFNEHENALLSVAVSPDGKRIIFGTWGNTVSVWDAQRGTQMLILKGHKLDVNSVAVSPDSKRIISGSDDNTVRVWDAASGELQLTLRGHESEVRSVAMSPDGKRIISGSKDKTVRVWDVANGMLQLTLKGHEGGVTSVAVSPDGKRIISGSHDNTVGVWDAVSGAPLLTLKGHGGGVTSVAVIPDGRRIVSGSHDNTVRVWDAVSGAPLLTLKGHRGGGGVTSVAVTPDGKRIISASWDRTVRIWDATNSTQLLILKGHGGGFTSVALSPDGKRIISCSSDGTARIWDATSGSQMLILKGHKLNINSVAVSPDGKRIISGSDDNTVRVWDAANGAQLLTLKGHRDLVSSIAMSPDGKRIISGSGDSTVRVWDAERGTQLLSLKGHKDWVTSVAVSPDGQRIISGSIDGTARVWNAASGKRLLTFRGHGDHVTSVAVSPDSRRIISASGSIVRGDTTVRVWDAASGELQLTLKGHKYGVNSVAVTPDGKRIISGSDDDTVRVWDAASGKQLLSLKGHKDRVSSVAVSPDGQRIISGSDDTTVRVWDVARGTQLLSLKGHKYGVNSVLVSPDGKHIISGSYDKTIRLWPLPTTRALVVHGLKIAPRCLTQKQRQQFFLLPEPPAWCYDLKKWPYQNGRPKPVAVK